jgi:hypothetical protein
LQLQATRAARELLPLPALLALALWHWVSRVQGPVAQVPVSVSVSGIPPRIRQPHGLQYKSAAMLS